MEYIKYVDHLFFGLENVCKYAKLISRHGIVGTDDTLWLKGFCNVFTTHISKCEECKKLRGIYDSIKYESFKSCEIAQQLYKYSVSAYYDHRVTCLVCKNLDFVENII
ncbi:hypothetical protein AYI70_g2499 [Smittium culicis]|uniref:Uncharacterized protein n=1 Tax=Smittium culicis TaxID=133412 RepID=A0A1R1Y821_9FUNG|nr:hypothetical protein AYI70_g2499 [Smittium culicis]